MLRLFIVQPVLLVIAMTMMATIVIAGDLPLVVVTNGSANEGYWSVYYLLKTGRVKVRATVRNLSSPRAKALQELSVNGRKAQVVQAANNQQDALTQAFQGAQGIYATTVYNVDPKRKFDPDNQEEVECGRAIIAAAKNSKGLKTFLWQTMMRFETHPPDIGLPIPVHFKTKWELEEEIKDAKLPSTFLRQPAYMRQMRFMMGGKRRFKSTHPPQNKIGLVEEEDIGKLVASILAGRNPKKYVGKTINAVTELATPPDLVARAQTVVPGFDPHYRQTSPTFSKYLFQMLGLVLGGPTFGYVGAIAANFGASNPVAMNDQDVKECQRLTRQFGGLTTFEGWLENYLHSKPNGDAMDVQLQKKFQAAGPK